MRTVPLVQKCTSREGACDQIREWQRAGLKVGFTSGVFDLLHAGHVDYLEEAARACDRLVIAVNSDASVRKIKGDKRPICSEQGRQQVLAALACVDLVFPFDEPNNNVNVEVLRPDLYIKAGDYNPEKLTSGGIVEAQGGKVLISVSSLFPVSCLPEGWQKGQVPVSYCKNNQHI